ncbi:hypothetical protein Syun_031021 [Stephania yunnanensis]|uniref:Uncharacterized protein n=1 Tax=Stephania yunnanensis TaxID=152371 RepID=A0AAP0DVD8_9MAGN
MMKSNIIAFSKNKRRDDDDDEMMVMLRKEFDELEGATPLSAPNFYGDYLLRKSIADMEMCINKHSSLPLHHLLNFLGKPTYGSMELLKQIGQSSDELLLLVCLVVSHELYDIISIIGEPRISNVIIGGTNEQIGELYDLIEQLFVALLHSFIEQLPGVIFNGLNEGVPTLEFQNNVTISMKLIARLKILEMEPSGFAKRQH